MLVVLTDSWAVGRSRDYQIFLDGKFTTFSYPWCSAARSSRARARYKFGSSHEKFDVWPIGLKME